MTYQDAKTLVSETMQPGDGYDAITVDKPQKWDGPEAVGVVVCWACEESLNVTPHGGTVTWLKGFLSQHRRCHHPAQYEPETPGWLDA